jgi:hypothetical protein
MGKRMAVASNKPAWEVLFTVKKRTSSIKCVCDVRNGITFVRGCVVAGAKVLELISGLHLGTRLMRTL